MKLRRLVIVALVFVFASFLSLSVNAGSVETSELISVKGAQIRTEGNQGIRFVGTEAYEGTNETAYGIVLAFGEAQADENFVKGGTVNGKEVVYGEVDITTDLGDFFVTLYNVPESFYTQEVSARAYVVDGDTTVYGTTVTVRSLADVAIAADEAGNEAELVTTVVNYVRENYLVSFVDGQGNLNLASAQYEANHAKLAEAFVADWNATLGTELDPATAFVVESYGSPFRTSARSSKSDTATVHETSGLYQFFNDEEIGPRWSWLLDYILNELTSGTSYTSCKYQIEVIRGAENTEPSNSWYYGFTVISYIQSIFNAKGTSSGSGQFKFENYPEKLALIADYNNQIEANLEGVELIQVGETYILPEGIEKAGYIFTWGSYVPGTEITVIGNMYLKATYTTIEYNITYYDGDNELTELNTTYTIEDTVVLPEYDKSGYIFNGWYDNPEFEGEAISELINSYGDKVFYAKFTTTDYVEVNVTFDLNGGMLKYPSVDAAIADYLADYNAYAKTNHTVDTYYALGSWAEIANASKFLYNETYRAKWSWLVEYIASVASSTNKHAFEVFGNYSNYSDFSSENSNNIYVFAYELRAWVGQAQWTKNANFATADYSSAEVQAAFTALFTMPGTHVYLEPATLPTPLKEGVTFKGWLCNLDNQIYTEYPGYKENPGDLVLTAVFTDEVVATGFEVTNLPSEGLELYQVLQLEWLFTPINTYNQELAFASSDENVLSVDKYGVVTAKAVGSAMLFVSVLGNPELDQLYMVDVYIPGQFKFEYETESYVNIDETIQINAAYVNNGEEVTDLNWESLDPEVATVENGTVTGVSAGTATIRASLKYDSSKYVDIEVTVLPEEMSEILAEIVASHESNVFVEFNLGIGAGTPEYYADIYGSVNKILFNDALAIDEQYLEAGNAKYEGQDRTMSSVEFITVHYTGNMKKGSTASANAGYFVQDTHSTSIHYVTGNDGVYHCMDDDQSAAHAGDSSSVDYVGAFEWLDTGVAFNAEVGVNPTVTVSDDYYYEVNGQKTSIALPQPYSYNGKAVHTYSGSGKVTSGTNGTVQDAEAYFNVMGFKFIEKEGNYYMAKTWWCYSQVSEGKICSVGGNSNSIGIESAVNEGSDLWYTWQKTAQLVAQLMVNNNLDINRVVGHHFYTGKDCPQPLLENNCEIWKEFLELVEVEYALLTKYADYEITMEVVSGDCLADTGRVTQAHETQLCTYKVTVTNKTTSETEEIVLSSVVPGDFFK